MVSIPSRLSSIEIPEQNPFLNDKLGYKKYASILQTLVDSYAESGCVLAINGKWGTGKTTFMKMWQAYLCNSSYTTIYFNAWETDYFSDPLTAILGELQEISKENETLHKAISAAGKLAVGLGKGLIKSVALNKLGIDPDIVETSIDAGADVLKDSLDEYEKQKSSITEFRSHLSEYVASNSEKPVVFIIDELDRCNPHYAVKTLETIKHLFEVPNIIFVLAIDKSQLEFSIKGFYGSDGIDAENYLRRFIDIQFDIPEPNSDGFIDLLHQHYQYSEFFEEARKDLNGSTKERDFLEMARLMFNLTHLDLRTWDKIFSHTRLAASQLGSNEQVVLPIAFILCFLRTAYYSYYVKIRNVELSIQEMINTFETIFPKELICQETSYHTPNNRFFIYVLGELLYFYDYSIDEDKGVLRSHKKDESIPLLATILDLERITEAVEGCLFRNMFSSCLGIDYFTKKIDLLDNFK